jgi:hypothetical protein
MAGGVRKGIAWRLEGSRVEMLKGEEPNAERLSTCGKEKRGEGRADWVGCDENMGEYNARVDYCQDTVL